MTALLLPVLLPAAVGVLLLLLGPRADRAALPVAVATAAGGLGLLLGAGQQERDSAPFLRGGPFVLGVDGLSLALGATVGVVAVCVLLASATQVERRRARLAGGLLVFVAAVLLTLAARGLVPLLVGWELMGAASYALIAHDLRDGRAVGSATTALLTTRSLDVGLYVAAGAAYAGGSSLDLAALPDLTGAPLHLAALGVAAAALGKAAQLPVSFWLSRAMDGPSPVSALLHSAAMVAMGGYLLLRTAPLLAASGWADDLVAWTGALTAVALGLVALAQRDLKQLLAASTAAQLGFVVLAGGLGATAAGSAHLVGHAAVKSLLFLAAGVWLHALGTRDLDRLRGAARRTPAVGALAVAGLLSLAGLPPLALWGTKDAVLAAALERGPALYAVALVGAALSAAYAGAALVALLRPPRGSGPAVGPEAWGPLVPLALGAVGLGVLAVGPVADRWAALVGGPATGSESGLVVSAVLAALALVAVVRLGTPGPPLLRDWLHLERAAHAVAVRPVLALAAALAVFDDRVLDRAVEGAVPVARRTARALARLDDGVVDGAVEATARGTVALAGRAGRADVRTVDGAVEALATGARRLGALARRPQTGQLHDYYGQAAALLVAATLLLLLAT